MKHIKTYKIFENYSEKSPEEICEEIEDILLPLCDEELKVEAYPLYEKYETYLYVSIKDGELDYDFDIEEFADQFKQLFSYVESEGWYPMGEDDYIIKETPGGQKFKADGSFVNIMDYEYVCPECGSDETHEGDVDTEICDKCEHEGHPDYFIVSRIKFGTLDKLLFLIKRRLTKIDICFIKK